MKRYFVYILTSQRNGTLYVGSTSNLIQRVWQHKSRKWKLNLIEQFNPTWQDLYDKICV
ncbi:MAG: hypothetical protein EPO11_01850 [Gammaproteobacteria bacterium]|nr:MAG: hypothetical protein EPO11_01850 [Gammaproteobacteria bacterium]